MIADNAKSAGLCSFSRMWQPIGTESYDVGLELAVIVDGRVEWSLQPCRRVIGGWVHCETHESVPRRPTHWRPSLRSIAFGMDWQTEGPQAGHRADR
ncbi:hypothetical protein [Rhodopseudomonas palustris]|uniref:Uncharacterized protein n=1 Tax=Rhodopseudomonas palustris TaxID=1076 RepID=A0A418VKL0_RHOPL|nr:hypothetical protein [Rhodopseudomonas palustris]RJF76670.1 hypothetical protein D4Q52_05890 [Rhodopseudomonas palustris]